MGQDKALLRRHHQAPTLLARTCAAAAACTTSIYILSPWPQRYQDAAAVLLEEPHPGQGPLCALEQGWQLIDEHRLPPDWLLLLACDLPALDGPTLRDWMKQTASVGAAIAALPHAEGRWQPLCGFYHRRCRPSLTRAVATGTRSFQKWLKQETILTLRTDSANVLQNCNTPAEWREFLHQGL